MRTIVHAAIVTLLIGGCTSLLPFDRGDDFEDLPAEEARARLQKSWPSDVDTSAVQSVSFRWRGSRDSSSKWYRIELDCDAAGRWTDQTHAEAERDATAFANRSHISAVEGVHREIAGPPSLRDQTGVTPAWWSPPKMDYRATEAMLWYSDNNSGVARAAYSGFDASAGVLWIYLYTCQHDRMWARADLPAGEHFGVNSQAEMPRHREENDENRSTSR